MNKRNEYPRPQFQRKQWTNLNGEWEFAFDDENQGIKKKWDKGLVPLPQRINVPFVYQSELSQINQREVHDTVWYRKAFEYFSEKKVVLHFGAVDYQADIFLNGRYVGGHIGGHTSFSFDVTAYLKTEGQQILVVKVYDPHSDETIPRGKQFWEKESRGIWYTNSTGIWQTVWLEEVAASHIKQVVFQPDVDYGKVGICLTFPAEAVGKQVGYQISFQGEAIASDLLLITSTEVTRSVELYQNKIFRSNFHDNGWTWSPETPNLFDVSLKLIDSDDSVLDQVESYFGFRKIHTEKGMTFLNNYPYYQRLVLDQGYWPTGLLTAPTDEDYKRDIELAKEMGFNGCRKHQKVEDPRFLYWADKLGFLVWGECASAPVYTEKAVERLTNEWFEIIERDRNHPSIVTWVPLNESWGVPNIHHNKQQQHFSEGIYHLIHSLDRSRLVISNDGWEMTVTDICAIHNYSHGSITETKKYDHFINTLSTVDNLINQAPGKWGIYAEGYGYQGEPIMLTEFGGIGYQVGEQDGWGYTSVSGANEFISEYGRIMSALYGSKALYGYCYTQLTDVEQEINGLLAYDRTPKCELAKIKEINLQYFPERLYSEAEK